MVLGVRRQEGKRVHAVNEKQDEKEAREGLLVQREGEG